MELRIYIDLDGDAFVGDCSDEVRRIAGIAVDRFGAGNAPDGLLLDYNGNVCGKWEVVD